MPEQLSHGDANIELNRNWESVQDFTKNLSALPRSVLTCMRYAASGDKESAFQAITEGAEGDTDDVVSRLLQLLDEEKKVRARDANDLEEKHSLETLASLLHLYLGYQVIWGSQREPSK